MTYVRDSYGTNALPLVKHKQPCNECPFRRVAAAGWLGGGTVAAWVSDLTFGDTAFVCHMAEQEGKRHMCAGSMIHYRNSLKVPRDPTFADAVMQYAPDKEKVFAWTHEFKEHHLSGMLKEDR